MKIITKMIAFFIIAQLLALFIGMTLIDNSSRIQEYQSLNIAPAAGGELTNVVYLLGMILMSALLLLIIFLFPMRDLVIRLLEFSATVVSSTIVFFVFLSFMRVPASDLVALVLSVALYLIKFVLPNLRLILAIIASAGVAAVIGFSLEPFPMVILVVAIAIYDIIAVWWTGHMITFARQFVKMKTTFTITSFGERGGINEKTKMKGGKPMLGSMELGTGDLAIPGALCVSAYKFGSILFPAGALLGAIFGLYLVLDMVEREKRIMPAIPSIGMFSLFGLFAVIILFHLFAPV
jgi:presenilin-like A22 family membrane protease